LWRRII